MHLEKLKESYTEMDQRYFRRKRTVFMELGLLYMLLCAQPRLLQPLSEAYSPL